MSLFGGETVKVLKEENQEFEKSFEKAFEKKSVLRKESQYYYQVIRKGVTSEGNGRPVTYYNENVYPMKTADIEGVSLDNIWDYASFECVFNKSKSKEGVWDPMML